ncbi:AMP-binding protein [Actinomycetospora chiangmaiensis]|uniref:AMP-binding protein n=1 Tax=Actinomycetospora chiangmaiensis TaxID=402650 RepID=UPI0005244F5E|nr:AMP-binding protein [Actinomycetospora chiangmaiensis]
MYPGSVARQAPSRPAMVLAESGETVTYAELDERSARLATALRARGLADGDTVAILLGNDVRWGEVCWACWRSGLVLAAVNHHLAARELVAVLAQAAPRAVVTTPEILPALVGALGDTAAGVAWLVVGKVPAEAPDGAVELDDLVAGTDRDPDLPERAGGRLLFSSGTTGTPKPARVAPRDVHPDELGVRSAGLMRTLGFSEPGAGVDVLLVPGPAYHAGPIGFLQSVHQAGGTVVLMRRFDAAGALAAIERYRVTHSQWVPTMFVRLLRLPDEVRGRFDLSSHRVAVHAAAPCPPAVKRAVLDWWGPIVHEYYGASEGYGRTVIGPREWLAHPGSVGRAVGSGVVIADAAGRLLPPGQDGAVWFTAPGAAEPERGPDGGAELAATPGWGAVGDLGHLDADGYLYLTGRASQLIITGGVNVAPREVELVLEEHPDVDEVAVVGVPDEEFGERVVAVVVPRYGVAPDLEDRLVAWARDRLAHVKCPRAVQLVDELPRNDAGKVLHRVLVARLSSAHSSDPGGS